MPSAWKVMLALALVLVLFAIPYQLFGSSLPTGPTLVGLVVVVVASAVGFVLGRRLVGDRADEEE